MPLCPKSKAYIRALLNKHQEDNALPCEAVVLSYNDWTCLSEGGDGEFEGAEVTEIFPIQNSDGPLARKTGVANQVNMHLGFVATLPEFPRVRFIVLDESLCEIL